MNTDGMTLVEFLRARIDEDERAALDAVPSELDRQPEPYEPWYANEAESSGDTIVAMHPSRALAEVEAKRGIVEWIRGAQDAAGEAPVRVVRIEAALTHALRLLALPYAGHPDYDEAWRP
jgi:hypothetical protein